MKRNNLPFPLDGVFIDSFATLHPTDVQQQEAFARETAKLWNFFSTKDKFVFKSIQDILDALYKCERETSKDIEMLKMENEDRKVEIEILNSGVDTLNSDVDSLTSENENRKIEIEALEAADTEFDESVTFLTSENGLRVSEIDSLEIETSKLVTEVNSLKVKMDNLTIAPLGSIVAWTPKPDKETNNLQSLPSGWVECDGSQIKAGIWRGQYTPNLNGEKRFLRGGLEKDVLKLEYDEMENIQFSFVDRYVKIGSCQSGDHEIWNMAIRQGNTQDDPVCERTETFSFGSGSETKPINMNVIWIMKIF